ncbi:MAG: DUF488 domain-containing protein [Rhodospirillaceae bacterium]|nr:DUF488 domain-containing protein [Rhodospirillaceae bacterium]
MPPEAPASRTVYTVGHSHHALDHFLSLLAAANITAVADVRSTPYSRRNPQFNREALKAALAERGIAYVPMEAQLGGRPPDPSLWRFERPDYERIAATPNFCEGLGRIETGAATQRIALMCAERDPLDCHRCLLVGRALKERGTCVLNILGDGALEDQSATEARLLAWAHVASADMFDTPATRLADAYRKRAGWNWGERT